MAWGSQTYGPGLIISYQQLSSTAHLCFSTDKIIEMSWQYSRLPYVQTSTLKFNTSVASIFNDSFVDVTYGLFITFIHIH